MPKIRLLSDHLANQIAAGEVVERPASVAKELVENSLDAGATRVSVQVEGSGARLVRVADNGEGMDEDDVLLSLERHATSKLREDSRLDAIETLGFRGEALPSIGSVSRLILLSRTRERGTGTRAEIRYGRLHGVHEAGCAQGTVVEVHNLFGNVPARKKFLKSPRTELSHIEEVVRNQSLAHVGTAFVLEVEGRPVLDLPARETLEQRFYDLFRCSDYWLRIETGASGEGAMRLQGYLLHPEPASTRGSRLRILVNGRPVQDRMIRHAVMEGLHSFLMKGESPGGVLLLDLPADQIDVNVHPAKQEIRFRNSRDVHRFIVQAVAGAVRRYQDTVRSEVFAVPAPGNAETSRNESAVAAPTPQKQPVVSSLFAEPVKRVMPKQRVDEVARTAERAPVYREKEPPRDTIPQPEEAPAPGDDLAGLTLVGQLFDLYLLCEQDGKLIVIDQHAAHERILYEQLYRNYLEQSVPQQSLMFPVSVELSVGQAEIMEARSESLISFGFRVDHFGDETWIVKAVPALVSQLDPRDLLFDILEGLRAVPDEVPPGFIAPGIESLLASMACKAAVKAGNRMAPEEMLELLATMRDTGTFSHCPHGRPVLKTFSRREIEQWFRRT